MMGSLTTSLENSTGAVHDVVESDGMFRDAQANRSRFAVGTAAFGLGGIERTAFSCIDGRLLVCERMLSLPLQFFLRTKAEISFALAQQPLGLLAIELETIALTIGGMRTTDVRTFIPIEAKPLQVFEKLALKALLAALDVRVLDAQDHDATLLPREEPVEQRGAGVTNVQMSGWRRGESNTNLGGRDHSTMLAVRTCGADSSLIPGVWWRAQ